MGWTIVFEEQETGVSGFKVSANDRDKFQLIKEYTEQDKFDILLVFMFDRIGRRAEETPFVVEWFVRYGISYQEVVAAAREAMRRLIRQMESSLCENSEIESKVERLAEMLRDTPGKKVYGYLKKPVKAQVDSIVDELARLPEVAECYEVWNRLRDEVEGYYKDRPREWLPLSRQKEFKAIKNAVIREAENIRLGVVTFEHERMADEIEKDSEAVDSSKQTVWQLAWEYRDAKSVLYDDDASEKKKEEAVHTLEQLWDCGFTVAAHQLGKCWRDGLGVLPDDKQAELWFRRSAGAGNDFSQYALGKLLQGQKRIDEAVSWYEQAAAQGNRYAAYRLGKLYLTGEDIPKDVYKAIEYLTASAQQGNQYAQRFFREPEGTEEELEMDQAEQALKATLDREQRKLLLTLVNGQSLWQARVALESFIAGFRLALGIAWELEPYSPVWPDGKRHAKNVYATTREECEEKLKVLIREMQAERKALQDQIKGIVPSDKLHKKQRQIWEYMKFHPEEANLSAIAKGAGVKRHTVAKHYEMIRGMLGRA